MITCIEEKPQGMDVIRALIAHDIMQYMMWRYAFIFDENAKPR